MKHIGTQPIETERLRLRRVTLGDAETAFASWTTDPEVARWMRWTPHENVEETRGIFDGWVAAYERDDFYLWGITLKESGVLIGTIGIWYVQEQGQPPSWEPGYNIARAYWGRGYTSEALAAVVDFFVQNTGLQELRACHAAGNPASGRVMEHAGFVYEHPGVYHKPDGTEVPARYYRYCADAKGEA